MKIWQSRQPKRSKKKTPQKIMITSHAKRKQQPITQL